ncbi:MAG: DUF296 domain-containing protein [Candidatus Liptonbacteria bacterium]|nr:DUF296 domain-containing protein [Candidatus Liptonbacteria bacterium]
MKTISRDGRRYILKFEKGEHYPNAFVKFLEKEKISGGFFVGLGACSDPEISFYDLKKKKYVSKRFKGDMEVLNVAGNVAKSGKETVIHQHISLGRENFSAIGGHLMSMKIAGTLEIFLIVTPSLRRSKDKDTGLNLLVV